MSTNRRNLNVQTGKQGFQKTTKGQTAPRGETKTHTNIALRHPKNATATKTIAEQAEKFQKLMEEKATAKKTDKLTPAQHETFNACMEKAIVHARHASQELNAYASHLPRGQFQSAIGDLSRTYDTSVGRNLRDLYGNAQTEWTDANSREYFNRVEQAYKKSQRACNDMAQDVRDSKNKNFRLAYQHMSETTKSLHTILATIERSVK